MPFPNDALAQDTAVVELQHINSLLAERLAQRIVEGDEAAREAERLQRQAIAERDAHAETSAQLAHTNAELEHRLADRSHEHAALAHAAAVVELQHTNSKLAERLAQRIAEGDQAAQKTERLESALSEAIEQRGEIKERVARQTLESMDDITWALAEVTRTDDEQAEKTQSEYAARLENQIGERLEHFNGALTNERTLEENPARRNSLDRIWGKTGLDEVLRPVDD